MNFNSFGMNEKCKYSTALKVMVENHMYTGWEKSNHCYDEMNMVRFFSLPVCPH